MGPSWPVVLLSLRSHVKWSLTLRYEWVTLWWLTVLSRSRSETASPKVIVVSYLKSLSIHRIISISAHLDYTFLSVSRFALEGLNSWSCYLRQATRTELATSGGHTALIQNMTWCWLYQMRIFWLLVSAFISGSTWVYVLLCLFVLDSIAPLDISCLKHYIVSWRPLLTFNRLFGCLCLLLDLCLFTDSLRIWICIFFSPSGGLLMTSNFTLTIERQLLLEAVSDIWGLNRSGSREGRMVLEILWLI